MNMDEEVEGLVTENTFKAAGKLRKASSKNARSRTCRFITMLFTVLLGSFAGSFIATGGFPDGFHLKNITKDKNVTTSLPHVQKSSRLDRKIDRFAKKNGLNIDDFDLTEVNIVRKRPDFVNPNSTVGQIVLIGERNTGSRWISRLLASCFPDIYVRTIA